MANTITSIEIPASPAQVWQLIGGFDALPDWLPYIPSSKVTEGGISIDVIVFAIFITL
ncbi:SRPBCC family protein, partial [Bacillus sp. B-TM1]